MLFSGEPAAWPDVAGQPVLDERCLPAEEGAVPPRCHRRRVLWESNRVLLFDRISKTRDASHASHPHSPRKFPESLREETDYFQKEDKLDTPEKIDKYVKAQLPFCEDPDDVKQQAYTERLSDLIKDMMAHSPCAGKVSVVSSPFSV